MLMALSAPHSGTQEWLLSITVPRAALPKLIPLSSLVLSTLCVLVRSCSHSVTGQ